MDISHWPGEMWVFRTEEKNEDSKQRIEIGPHSCQRGSYRGRKCGLRVMEEPRGVLGSLTLEAI